MKKNTQVETAQKSQATNKIQPENVQNDLAKIDSIRKVKKDKTPTGKVTLMKETEARKKAREEQYRTFRINALRRRCSRMGLDNDKTEELVKKLIEQMNSPKEYYVLVMFYKRYPRKKPKEGEVFKSDSQLFDEALKKENIQYKYCGDTYYSIDANENTLAKIREIAPENAKIHIYAKKAESVLSDIKKEVIKKPSNNTAEAKKNAKAARKALNKKRGMHKPGKGKFSAKQKRRKTLSELKKQRKATTVQLNGKTRSTASKKASTSLKKAA